MRRNIIFLALISLFLIGIFVLALYIYNSEDIHLQKTNEFYFVSDYLTEDTLEYHLYGGSDQEFTFKLKNFEDTLRFSNKEITYNVKAVDKNGSLIDSKTGSIGGGKANEKNVSITIPQGYADNTEVLITAESAPFHKKLSAKLILHTVLSAGYYYIEDSAGQNHAKLIICANYEFAPKIRWAEEIRIDCTNPYIMNDDGSINESINTNTIQLNKPLKKGESIAVYFFKDTLQNDYSKSNTEIISENNEILVGF